MHAFQFDRMNSYVFLVLLEIEMLSEKESMSYWRSVNFMNTLVRKNMCFDAINAKFSWINVDIC